MKRTGNLGKLINFANEKTREIKPHYISIDRLTNEVVDVLADKVRIPNKNRADTPVESGTGHPPRRTCLAQGGDAQERAQVRGHASGERRQARRGVRAGTAEAAAGAASGKNRRTIPTHKDRNRRTTERGNVANRSWTNEDGSIRPISKWKDDTFTDQQKADYVAGKTVVLANAKDDQGQPCTKYLKFSFEKGRPLTYSQNPDLRADRRPVQREPDAARRKQRWQDQRGYQARERTVAARPDRPEGRNAAEAADTKIQRHEGILIAATKSIQK